MATWNVSSAAQLSSVLANVKGGDTVQLASGNYGTVDLSGRNFSSDVTIVASEPLGAVFTNFNISKSSYIKLDGVQVDGSMRVDNGSHHLTFVDSSFGNKLGSSDSTGFYAMNVSHIKLDGNDIGAGKYSLIMNNVQYFEVTDNTIHDARIDLMRVTGNSHHGLIENNTLRDVRPLDGDHPDAMQFFSVSGYTPHDIAIRGNYLYDDPATGQTDKYGMQGIFLKDSDTGFRNFVIDNNLVCVGSPNSIYVQNGKENVEVTNNTILSWKPHEGGAASLRLVGSDNSGTTVDGNVMLKLLDDTHDASFGKNLVYSNDPASPLYWGKLFQGTGSSWEGFLPKAGSPLDLGSYGAEARLAELLGGDTSSPAPSPVPQPMPDTAPKPGNDGATMPSVRYFLADAVTDQLLIELAEDATINPALYDGHSLSIVAVADSAASGIESIRMNLDNGKSIRVESVEPYALFGDDFGDLRGGLTAGEHTVKFDFYADDGQGVHLGSESLSFTVAGAATSFPAPAPAPVEGGGTIPSVKYFLADGDTDQLLVELADGATINPALYDGHSLSIMAVADSADGGIESIRMNLDSGTSIRIENVEPYALFGDTGGDLRGGLTAGEHNVKFDFYADDAQRVHLGSESLSFTVVGSSALTEGALS